MKRATPFVLLLFTLSGVAGLVYEIVWIRMLSHLLGGTSYAISTVLAAFMAGLALGSRFYGRRADDATRPLRLYAKLEFGIAALGAIVYAIIEAAPPVYGAIAGALPAPALTVLRVVITGILLIPPTFLMGGTLPVLSRYIVRSRERLGRGLGLLYAVNTLGAVGGSFLTGFVFIATLGLLGSTVLAIAINLIVGVIVWRLDRGGAPLPKPTGHAPEPKRTKKTATVPGEQAPDLNYALLSAIFALSGFASLGYELYWTRGLQHFLGNSTYAFSAMLTTFLLGLAGGGWVGGRWVDRVRSPGRLLGWVQVAVGVFALTSVLLIWEWLPRMEAGRWLSGQGITWSSYLLRRFGVAFAVMLLPTFFTGMTFPIVNRIGIQRLDKLARGVGSLYYANTIGAIVGSLVAGFVVLPLLGARSALVATGFLSMTLGLLVHLGNRRRSAVEPIAAVTMLVVFLLAWSRLTTAGGVILSDTQDPTDVVLYDAEDHTGETRVYRKPTGELHMSVDGHHIGGTDFLIVRKEKVLAHLPMVLMPQAKGVLAVGLGSGVTLGSLAKYKDIERLSCVEIVPSVVDGARLFAAENGSVLDDPRLRLHVGDGVQYLLTSRDRFDIISSDSKLNPEYSGNAALLSRNYYEICRDRLTDDGVMVQWLAVHLPVGEIRVILRSFINAFPNVAVYWYNPGNIILAGSKSPLVLDIDAARRFAKDAETGAELAMLELDDPYSMASLWIAGGDGLRAAIGDGPVNSWQRPISEFNIGRRYREKASAQHEDDTLRWLLQLRDADGQRLTGEYDGDIYARYIVSSGTILEGFSLGGGTGHVENGLAVFKSASAANPDDRRLRELIKRTESLSSNLEDAITGGQLDTPEALVRAGLLRRDQGRHRESLDLFDRAFASYPDDPNIQYNRLLALKSVGETVGFRDGLEAFLAAFPRDARGHSLQGRELAAAGDFETALAEFETAAALDPESPVLQNNVATALARLQRYEEAARAFEAVCKLQPTYPDAAFFAAASFSKAGMAADSARWARFCLDNRLADASRFATDPLFAHLRESEFWDPTRGAPR